jgi:hypothetical protein
MRKAFVYFWPFGMLVGGFAIGINVALFKLAPERFDWFDIVVAVFVFFTSAYFFKTEK